MDILDSELPLIKTQAKDPTAEVVGLVSRSVYDVSSKLIPEQFCVLRVSQASNPPFIVLRCAEVKSPLLKNTLTTVCLGQYG